jgi:hypothetical protein
MHKHASQHVGEEREERGRGLAPLAQSARKLIEGGWVTDERGIQTVLEMIRILANSPSERNRIAAARTIATLASVDVRREANSISVRGQDSTAATATLRAFLSTPDGAAILASLSAPLLAEQINVSIPPDDTVPPSS